MDDNANGVRGLGSDGSAADQGQTERLRVRYRYKDAEFEAEGVPTEVNRHAAAFLSFMSGTRTAQKATGSGQLALFEETEDVPLLADNGTSKPVDTVISEPRDDAHLLSLYLDKALDPSTGTDQSSQTDQLLIITWYFEVCEHQESVEISDYRHAYSVLAKVPVSTPKNISARVNNLLEKGMLHKASEGYALTLRGKQAVAGMPHAG